MFFALTDDQREFGTAVTTYLAERFDLEAVRGVVEDPTGDGNPDALWKAAAEQGWLAATVPEEHDGLGLGLIEAQVIARSLGAGVAPGPWRGTVLAADAIRLAGSPEQQAAWLPTLASGEAVGAFSLRADRKAVEYAGVADVVVLRDGDGLVLAERSGFTTEPVGSYDGTTRLAHVAVEKSEALPGAIGDLTARATVLVASDLAGVAREAITRTVAYDREREQFGVPVGSFQAIKHAMADLHVGVTMAEHAVLHAAHAVDTGADGADLAVAVAKAKASDAALAATAAMIQYHGGIGYTWEHEAHLFYKRAKRLAGQYGDADAQRERIATLTIG